MLISASKLFLFEGQNIKKLITTTDAISTLTAGTEYIRVLSFFTTILSTTFQTWQR